MNIISNDSDPRIVVLSAVAGTTNDLVKLAEIQSDKVESGRLIDSLHKKYRAFISELDETGFKENSVFIDDKFDQLRSLCGPQEDNTNEILAQGELISTRLFHNLLKNSGIESTLLNALDFMVLDKEGEPDIPAIKNNLSEQISAAQLFITQGFICRDEHGAIANLARGGSDYTASLIGAAIEADEVQIWTDIDGMHNNDPRHVKGTYPISELSFDEAAELAYFGAKILHPSSILPAQKFNIPVRLKSTMNETAPGTLISAQSIDGTVKAIAVKDGITAIKIKSTRMLLAYGFLRRVFEVFENHKTAIDMITTSEVAVSLTIDDSSYLPEIVNELKEFGLVEVDENQSIVCVVGNMVSEKKGVVRKIFNALSDIPIRMVSYGGSRFNISMLIDSSYKFEALNNLNSGLFESN